MDYASHEDYEDYERYAVTFSKCRLQDLTDPLNIYEEQDFRERFRMSKRSVKSFYGEIEDFHECTSLHGVRIPIMIQLLVALLRFYASGCFLQEIGDLSSLSKSSASRCIHRQTKYICKLRPQMIAFPNADQMNDVKRKFFDVSAFPGEFSS